MPFGVWYNIDVPKGNRKGSNKMKQYGFNKATEFTRKQINVVWAKAKNCELKIEKWIMSDLYNLADYYGTDDNRSVEQSERSILRILDAVFGGKLETAQNLINEYTESTYNLLGANRKAKIDRTAMVA